MSALLTCDDVFEVLTREPFPSGGADDEFVESHLAVCHECRQLAEAFRPAVGLFHESLSAGIDDELPMYRGRLKPIIATLSQHDLPSRSKSMRASGWPRLAIAASLLLIGSVVVALLAAGLRDDDSVAATPTVRAAHDRDYTLLAGLEIPRDCRSLLASADHSRDIQFVCCTRCHNATSRVASTNLAISKSTVACAACHGRMRNDVLSMVAPWERGCESLLACAAM